MSKKTTHCWHIAKNLKIMKRAISAVAAMLVSLTAYGVTREEIAQIQVGKEGNFSYWNQESAVLQTLKDYVALVTNPSSADYVAPEERVAVFDLDGTLICETAPTYFEWLLYLHRVLEDEAYPASAAEKAYAEEVKAAVENHSIPAEMDWGEAYAQNAAFTGMTMQQYADYVGAYGKTEVEGYNGMLWEEAFYLPMVEVVSYLASNDFKTYIVSGSERQLLRVLAGGVLKFETNHIIGSDVETYGSEQGDAEGLDYVFKPSDEVLRGNLTMKNLKMNKVSSIVREIGIRPILAFGNSTGDFSMFQYTSSNPERTGLAFCVLADDTQRENGNPTKAASIKQRCEEAGWNTVSMKDDWKTIYGDGVERNNPTNINVVSVANPSSDNITIYGTKAASDFQGILIKEKGMVEFSHSPQARR